MHKQMLDLINSFPVIRDRVGGGLTRWDGDFISDPDGLLSYYSELSSGGQRVIEFALQVWSRHRDWTEYGFRTFNVVAAFGGWDEGQRRAFLAWAGKPFFP